MTLTEHPMSQVATSLEPGWRPDPSGRFEWRYWEGGWTNRVANSSPTGARPQPPAGPTGAPPLPASPAGAAPAAPPSPTAAAETAEVTAPPPAPAEAPAVPAPAPSGVDRVEPFGVDAPLSAPRRAEPTERRRGLWARVVGFFHSFVDQPESYRSELSGPALEHLPRGEDIVMMAPANYGRAGIVALAAGGIATGAYLPWLSGTVDGISFHRSGFDFGQGWGYWVGACALAVAAVLAVQVRRMRWVAMAVAIVLAGFVVRDLLDTYDTMQSMNLAGGVDAQIGAGLWIMIGSAAVGMIAGFRLGEDDKIV
jgi:hypothetical protein